MDYNIIKNIVRDIHNGKIHAGYSVEHQLPTDANENVIPGGLQGQYKPN